MTHPDQTFGMVRLLLAVLGLVAGTTECLGQYEPQVRVRVQSCAGGQCVIDYSNGVIVGNNDGLLVLTCAHCVRQSGEVSVWVGGNWQRAQIYRKDETDDVAALVVPGNYPRVSVPVWVDVETAPVGDEVEVRSYWPTRQWQPVAHRTHRIASNAWRCLELQQGVPSGVSGSPVYSHRGLIGIVSAADNRSTIVVPITVIQQHYIRWGLLPNRSPSTRVTSPLATGPSPLAPACDCHERVVAVEQKVQGALVQLTQKIQELASCQSNEAELAALQTQIQSLQAEVKELAPLKERRVILTTDGQISSQRTLKPADPLVLGSEVVIRRQGLDAKR